MDKSQKELDEINKKVELSLKQCGNQIAKMKSFMSDLAIIFGCIVDNPDVEKSKQSLTFLRFLETILYLDELLFLGMAAHYTSVIQILRYRLESMIQAVYLDQQHQTLSLDQKLCILEEISDKREYFTTRLVNMISMENKDVIGKLYKSLSKVSHPSHLDFPTVEKMIEYLKDLEASIDCSKLDAAADVMIQTYDVIFFITLHEFKEAKQSLKSNPDTKRTIEKYNMTLLNKIL